MSSKVRSHSFIEWLKTRRKMIGVLVSSLCLIFVLSIGFYKMSISNFINDFFIKDIDERYQHTFALSEEHLRKISPKANPEYIKALADGYPIMKEAGINTPRRLALFLAQLALESQGFKRLEENLNYSEKRLLVVFKHRVSAKQAKDLAHLPLKIANHVYGDRLGNRGKHTNDGWRYRGSGFIQLTGRRNYKEISKMIGMDLVTKPELARDPKIAVKSAVAYWAKHDFNSLADKNDLCAIRKRLNGGFNGVNETKQWSRRTFAILDNDVTTKINADGIYVESDVLAIIELLKERNKFEIQPIKDKQLMLTSLLRHFQSEEKIPVTGKLDYTTLIHLSDNREYEAINDNC